MHTAVDTYLHAHTRFDNNAGLKLPKGLTLARTCVWVSAFSSNTEAFALICVAFASARARHGGPRAREHKRERARERERERSHTYTHHEGYDELS